MIPTDSSVALLTPLQLTASTSDARGSDVWMTWRGEWAASMLRREVLEGIDGGSLGRRPVVFSKGAMA